MIVFGFAVGPLQANCYLVGDSSTRKAAVIDPGGEEHRILTECAKRQLKVEKILLTHAHPDHIGAAFDLRRTTRAELCCHRDETAVLQAVLQTGSGTSVEADHLLEDGEQIEVGNLHIQVIHTPGHTPGGVCYLARPCLFTGDTLFRRSIGRTDFPGGSHQQLLNSITSHLLHLDDDLIVLPGHMGKTTLGEEKRENPFLKTPLR